MTDARTQVAIVGAGPAGLLLQQLLRLAGVESVILEGRSRAYVEGRIRAGVLEPGSVALLDLAGVGERLKREGLIHQGVELALDGERLRIDIQALTGASVTVYGQSEITHDLFEAATAHTSPIVFEAEHVALHDLDGDLASVTWQKHGVEHRLHCDQVVGCDGRHGVSHTMIPAGAVQFHERSYPFGWLGLLADVAPCAPELIYANHAHGFALASMRSPTRSRYYIQVEAQDTVEHWPDERFWEEVALRLGPDAAAKLVRGPALEKSIAPLRSRVTEPMQWNRLFLAGDAAHLVPPTGAKGLNLAIADVGLLADALIAQHRSKDGAALAAYSRRALTRVWRAVRFSWWFTGLTHRFPDPDEFGRHLQRAEFDYLRHSKAAQTVLAENYAGLF
ncbi:MAG: 4-hydroxybenzoate 3-monooxygenase [Phenylobacterium sp.]